MIKPTAYGCFMMLVLLSKIEDIHIFNPTNLHKNAVKNYLNPSQTYYIHLNRLKTHQSRKQGFEL